MTHIGAHDRRGIEFDEFLVSFQRSLLDNWHVRDCLGVARGDGDRHAKAYQTAAKQKSFGEKTETLKPVRLTKAKQNLSISFHHWTDTRKPIKRPNKRVSVRKT